jgi:hypothetical protein
MIGLSVVGVFHPSRWTSLFSSALIIPLAIWVAVYHGRTSTTAAAIADHWSDRRP